MSPHIRPILAGMALVALAPGLAASQEQPRPHRLAAGLKTNADSQNGKSGLLKEPGQAAHGHHVVVGGVTTPSEARSPFTPKYLALRQRLLREFEHSGQIAETAEGSRRSFSDQSLYLGHLNAKTHSV